MDWWDSKRVEVSVAGKDNQRRSVDITCTPGQHFTGRSIFDHFKTLWASWTIEEIVPETNPSSRPPVKVFFAGDTGYRAVNDGEDEDKVPVCPAFKQIGDRFGGFDCALIPIGYVEYLLFGSISRLIACIQAHTSLVSSCPPSIVHRRIVYGSSKTSKRRELWVCIGRKSSSGFVSLVFLSSPQDMGFDDRGRPRAAQTPCRRVQEAWN
jgi:hypothetical protein